MPLDGIEIVEQGGQVFIRVQPNSVRSQVDAQAILSLLDESGYGDWAYDSATLAQAALDCNTRNTPFVVMVAEQRDAHIDIEIADDEMEATVSLTPGKGGQNASVESLLAALLSAGINVGIDHDAVREAVNADGAEKFVVARGEVPKEGSDSGFTSLVAEASDRAPRVNEFGLIDYREHGALTLVEPGAALMRRTPAVHGKPGHTVLGNPVEAQPVRDEPFSDQLSGAKVSVDDPDLLTADIAGAPVVVNCGVVVEAVLRVKEVDLASGNIYFDGTVQVEGDVNQNMKVQATGDIFVDGTVEGGALRAKGNVRVKGGIIAASTVDAGGSISARFAEGSSLSAGTIIALDDASLDSTLIAANQILIGAKNPQRGRLVGGVATAKLLLRVPILGSDKSALTKVVLGYDADLEARFKQLEQRLEQEKANEDNLQKLCKQLIAIKDPKGMLERAKASWRSATQTWGKSLVERTVLNQERAAILGAKLEIGVQTVGAIDFSIGSQRLKLSKEYGKGSFGMDRESRIAFTTPDGKATVAI
jgi:uncharacterized protein (DUF342 family)